MFLGSGAEVTQSAKEKNPTGHELDANTQTGKDSNRSFLSN